jgi:phage tail protein X
MSGTYTASNGDTWDSIAYSLYGDVKYTENLMAANQDADLLATVVFDAGTTITVPDIDTSDSSDDSDSLPPWRTS